MTEKRTVAVQSLISASPAHVYRAFATSPGLQEWMADSAAADARPGGRFYAWWNAGFYAVGTFQEAELDKKIAFTWYAPADPAPTVVTVMLEEVDGGTRLELVHSGIGDGDAWDRSAGNFKREWTSSLANLKSVLETGLDRRVFDRPMLGFYIGGLVDENLQRRLGIPVDFGMHVSGVLEGMGAQRSGLQEDDVIASVDGVEVRTYQSLAPVLARHKGGDVVRAVVYRGGEKLEMEIELSKRPEPEFPPPPQELAEKGWEAYKEVLRELKAALKGVSEKEAARRPGPGEWCVKEVMAHLLVSEHWAHAAWDLHPRGYKLPDYPSSDRLVAAIADTYRKKQLYRELKRSAALSMRMLETLPEDYAANRGAYFLTAADLENGIRSHFLPHIEQIRLAVEKVKTAGN